MSKNMHAINNAEQREVMRLLLLHWNHISQMYLWHEANEHILHSFIRSFICTAIKATYTDNVHDFVLPRTRTNKTRGACILCFGTCSVECIASHYIVILQSQNYLNGCWSPIFTTAPLTSLPKFYWLCNTLLDDFISYISKHQVTIVIVIVTQDNKAACATLTVALASWTIFANYWWRPHKVQIEGRGHSLCELLKIHKHTCRKRCNMVTSKLTTINRMTLNDFQNQFAYCKPF